MKKYLIILITIISCNNKIKEEDYPYNMFYECICIKVEKNTYIYNKNKKIGIIISNKDYHFSVKGTNEKFVIYSSKYKYKKDSVYKFLPYYVNKLISKQK